MPNRTPGTLTAPPLPRQVSADTRGRGSIIRERMVQMRREMELAKQAAAEEKRRAQAAVAQLQAVKNLIRQAQLEAQLIDNEHTIAAVPVADLVSCIAAVGRA